MPIFEYHCKKCNHGFEVMRLSRDGFKNIQCPKCESASVTKEMSTFSPAMASPSSGMPCSQGSCEMPQPMSGCPSGGCSMMD